MSDIKAIETEYKGYRFRSRLEARYAVFFDAFNIEFEYEKEGFELPSGRYLPDFWLPELKLWVEIKGQPPSEKEFHRIIELSKATMRTVLVIIGMFKEEESHGATQHFAIEYVFFHPDDAAEMLEHPERHGPNTERTIEAAKRGYGALLHADLEMWKLFAFLDLDVRSFLYAVDVMRSARFEYGEKGSPLI